MGASTDRDLGMRRGYNLKLYRIRMCMCMCVRLGHVQIHVRLTVTPLNQSLKTKSDPWALLSTYILTWANTVRATEKRAVVFGSPSALS